MYFLVLSLMVNYYSLTTVVVPEKYNSIEKCQKAGESFKQAHKKAYPGYVCIEAP